MWDTDPYYFELGCNWHTKLKQYKPVSIGVWKSIPFSLHSFYIDLRSQNSIIKYINLFLFTYIHPVYSGTLHVSDSEKQLQVHSPSMGVQSCS